ncbi:hypothetical protein [Sorangium cellulosum]|uniref:Uncharacterized protein n=1 Tax=Sorangium cellulosum So0157-2 TaxID=1254432 RepID=S4XYQ5_SORCE|nr:hypothetical protein [Sorangium cellulosum]AGP38362.1 hypothetical protein SCE1572_30085 [Sorangium cellulosum So0157-2]
MDSKIRARVTSLPGDENYIRDLESQFDWQIALTRAIAEYWRDPKGEKGGLAKAMLGGDPKEIRKQFKAKLNFELPLGMNLTFKKVDVDYKGESQGEPPQNGWNGSVDKLTANVVIPLPNPPKEADSARAIADYVATGKAYPFT